MHLAVLSGQMADCHHRYTISVLTVMVALIKISVSNQPTTKIWLSFTTPRDFHVATGGRKNIGCLGCSSRMLCYEGK